MKRNSQAGVALVITLILLSVITFMAVTFLVVSRREAGQVSTLTQQSNAKFAAEAALEHAKSLIIANMLTAANGYNFGLLVSTNYNVAYNPNAIPVNSLLNVGYTNVDGTVLTALQEEQMLNNQLILPRPPVFIRTNSAYPNNLDFRYYLDLNRNGRDDPSGYFQVTNNDGTPATTTGFAGAPYITNFYTGDPEWIGVLAHPDMRHSSSNQYIARYCFIALPIGDSLDINYIHNQSIVTGGSLTPGFLRNQGVGSWEINLAGFLYGLSSNIWNYNYYPLAAGGPSYSGYAFLDAAAIINYRYNGVYSNLQTVFQSYGNNGSTALGGDYIDEYARGPLMTNLYYPLIADPDFSLVHNTPWSGSDNPNQFFTPGDLFNKVPLGSLPAQSFSNHLYQAGCNTGTDDRYTFYRLLSQMSFGSSPEPAPYPFTNKINLNYNNLSSPATNFAPWTPLQFFNAAADRMLRKTFPNPIPVVINNVTNYYTITLTNIPIYPANLYTPSVQRILQLAANIYDASTNGNLPSINGYFPSVFRPIFGVKNGTNIYISGYTNENSLSAFSDYNNQIPIALPDQINYLAGAAPFNVYGVPWIIGAKKGFPNFNELSMTSISQIQRKVQITRTNSVLVTNVQYTVGISNVLGVELWNSYTAAFTNPITVTLYSWTPMSLTNEYGLSYPPLSQQIGATAISQTYYTWPGFVNNAKTPAYVTPSFQIPLYTNQIFLADQVYYQNPSPLFTTNSVGFILNQPILPHFGLNLTNRFRLVMTTPDANGTPRVIDYVSFSTNIYRDLIGELPGPFNTSTGQYYTDAGGVWATNIVTSNGASQVLGVLDQIQVSQGQDNPQGNLYPTFGTNNWKSDGITTTSTQQSGETQMQNFLQSTTNGQVQVPFSPVRKVVKYYSWEANDPLVHYTIYDLNATAATNWISYLSNITALPNLSMINSNYFPWSDFGKVGVGSQNDTYGPYNLTMRDPGITGSDAWQFPTNKYPNIGWLGRVHRGTPWQTVYLKSASVSNTWSAWTGNPLVINGTNDSLLTQPTNDWALMDLFTTSPNDNASRGQLSVNQTGAAAWAAILDGVLAVSNNATAGFVPMVIDPTNVCYVPGVGSTNTVQYLINSINATRNLTNFNGTFTSVGQICAVPQLTVQSPYLDTVSSATNLLTDAAYERIPQQILSLLRLGSPRYAIFAYGQSLKPAPASIVQSGPLFGMCTNYQITGEMATRTIVRFDNFPAPGQTTAPKAVVESFNVLAPE